MYQRAYVDRHLVPTWLAGEFLMFALGTTHFTFLGLIFTYLYFPTELI